MGYKLGSLPNVTHRKAGMKFFSILCYCIKII